MPEKIVFSPALLTTHCLIDVRTPLEFEEDHIPTATSIPLLTNQERVEIGTIYKQQGAHTARMRALECTCGRFADMVREIAAVAGNRSILVYCWRGGLRSLSVATLLELAGFKACQLQGGYKTYRNHVISYFENFSPPAPLVVIHGMTGIGKTVFINNLDQQNLSSIDLEGIAHHRGSAFGSVGLQQNFTQKRFETALWDAFRSAPADRPIVLEGESQRIGKFLLPGNLYEVMAKSCKAWCHASMETRVKNLTSEYGSREYRTQIQESLERIKKKLGGVRHTELENLLKEGNLKEFTQKLIEHYYDKLYYKHRRWVPDLELELEDYQKAESELTGYLSSTGYSTSSSMEKAKFLARPDGAMMP